MRRTNHMKFHMMAIGAISVIIVILFIIMRPKQEEVDPTIATGDRAVEIVSATWGLNCNAEITRMKKAQPVQLDDSGAATNNLSLVTPNNVLGAVQAICKGRVICNFNVDTQTLQSDPLPSCFKQLEIGYRCFNIDRLWKTKANLNESLSIDCNKEADKDRT